MYQYSQISQLNKNFKKSFSILFLIIVALIINSCGSDKSEEFTVVKNIQVGAFDKTLAVKGEQIFKAKCVACHKYDERLVGPALGKVTKRRTADYILSMITAPDRMLANNDTTKVLLKTYMTSMTNQNVTLEDARAIYEHLRDIANSR
ncbi:MAG: c-type cytochrome [Bacteroidota bacterium]